MSQRVPYLFRGWRGAIFISLTVVNIVLFAYLLKTNGRVPDYKHAIVNAMGLPIPLAMVGWMLGSGIALFYKRRLPYGERLDAVGGLLTLVIQFLFTLFCLLSLAEGW